MTYDKMKSTSATKKAKEQKQAKYGKKSTLDKMTSSFIVPLGQGNKKRK